MSYQEKFLEGILEELHCQLNGLPLERVKKEARELLQENFWDLNEVLELFLERLRVCRRCGAARESCDMMEAENEDGPYYFCEQCE